MGRNLANQIDKIKDYPLGVINLKKSDKVNTWEIDRDIRYKGVSIYKIEDRLMHHYIDKNMDDFYSHLCKLLPKYMIKRYLYKYNYIYNRGKYYASIDYYIDSNNTIGYSPYKKRPFKKTLPTKDFQGYFERITINYYSKEEGITTAATFKSWYLNEKMYKLKIISGKLITYYSKNYRYKRAKKEHDTLVNKYQKEQEQKVKKFNEEYLRNWGHSRRISETKIDN